MGKEPENGLETDDANEFDEYEIKELPPKYSFEKGILEFIMKFSNNKSYKWINNNPGVSTAIVITLGFAIMAVLFAFIIKATGLV